MKVLNGDSLRCNRVTNVTIDVAGKKIILKCIIIDSLPVCHAILGMDFIRMVGGLQISKAGQVQIGSERMYEKFCNTAISKEVSIEDKDFSAKYDGEKWTVSWPWIGNEGPQVRSFVGQYKIDENIEDRFNEEVEKWIENGWLVEYKGEVKSGLPLMAVIQEYKDKVRPVLDYKKLNEYVSSHTAESAVCQESMRKWRKMGSNVKILDLRNAYLQLHVSKDLWPYQVVKFKGQTYCLTRLGFGLNIAPKVMTKVVNSILSQNDQIRKATDSYIDDIAVNEDIVSVGEVKNLLNNYGLDVKEPQTVGDTRVLGLRTYLTNGTVMWKRDNSEVLRDIGVQMEFTKRQVFSYCGKLLGHYPVCNWLRPCCSYIKRKINDLGWEDSVNTEIVEQMHDLARIAERNDPVKGKWQVTNLNECTLWCDASSLALGIVIETDGVIIEDSSWLRKEEEANHINLAELESVIKGINVAIAWGFKNINLKTDSATVFGWISSLIEKSKRVKVAGLSEMLVKRRLVLLSDLIEAYNLQIQIAKVASEINKADALTRIPKAWLSKRNSQLENSFVAVKDRANVIKEIHDKFHGGLERTFYAVKIIAPDMNIRREEVLDVVKNCEKCLSIDPTPIRWEHGCLEVTKIWKRISVDVSHYENQIYLVIVDCGPSRYGIWRLIRNESACVVIHELTKVIQEMGIPNEMLLDNYASFRSESFREFLEKWNIEPIYRCANRPEGNGIVERHHRTIKRMAKRSGSEISHIVYWYNNTPNKSGKIPYQMYFNRLSRLPYEEVKEKQSSDDNERRMDFAIGEEVFLKTPNARCTDVWKTGVVTGLPKNPSTLEVNGMPYHISHVRHRSKKDVTTKNSVSIVEYLPNVIEYDIENNTCNHEKNDNHSQGNIVETSENEEGWIEVGPKGRPVRNTRVVDRLGVVSY